MSQAQEGNWEPALALLRRAKEPDEATDAGFRVPFKGIYKGSIQGSKRV